MLNLGDTVPNFTADATTESGKLTMHDFVGDSWAILFSHPADFTPVCTTELGRLNKLWGEFEKRGCKVCALSCDPVDQHRAWIGDITATQGCGKFEYPIIADESRTLAKQFGMVDPDEKDAKGMPMTCRAVFIIGPDKKLKLQLLYPASTGRNFDEILRVLDSLQLTANHSVATPVNWEEGGDCMVLPSVSNEAAKEKFPKGFKTVSTPSGKEYLRITPQPAPSKGASPKKDSPAKAAGAPSASQPLNTRAAGAQAMAQTAVSPAVPYYGFPEHPHMMMQPPMAPQFYGGLPPQMYQFNGQANGQANGQFNGQFGGQFGGDFGGAMMLGGMPMYGTQMMGAQPYYRPGFY